MNAWLSIPSARPAAEVEPIFAKWRAQGYKIALWRDPGAEPVECDLLLTGEYPGYARAVNALVAEVIERDPNAGWFVAGGDDTEPDPSKKAQEIARECSAHFASSVSRVETPIQISPAVAIMSVTETYLGEHLFGVMQPTGDRFAGGSIDRIAGSPWMGRDWCLRANGGVGPLWPEFSHMHVDECLQRTAEKLGVFWQRPDLTHLHYHFMRESADIDSPAVRRQPPPHLVRWNTPTHWEESKAIFKRLEAEGFASCMPLAEVMA